MKFPKVGENPKKCHVFLKIGEKTLFNQTLSKDSLALDIVRACKPIRGVGGFHLVYHEEGVIRWTSDHFQGKQWSNFVCFETCNNGSICAILQMSCAWHDI